MIKLAEFADFTYHDDFVLNMTKNDRKTSECQSGGNLINRRTRKKFKQSELLETFGECYTHAKWMNIESITPFDCWSDDKTSYETAGLFGTMKVEKEKVCLVSYRGTQSTLDW